MSSSISASRSCAAMPPTMITLTESARKSSASWRAMNFGYFVSSVLCDGFSKCGSSDITPDCCTCLKIWYSIASRSAYSSLVMPEASSALVCEIQFLSTAGDADDDDDDTDDYEHRSASIIAIQDRTTSGSRWLPDERTSSAFASSCEI